MIGSSMHCRWNRLAILTRAWKTPYPGTPALMQMWRPRPPVIGPTAVALSVVVALSGCADVADRRTTAGDAATKLLTAVAGKDGATACAVLAPDTAAEVEQSAGKPCDQAILDEDLPAPATVNGTDVYGQWAQVRLSDDTMFLAVFPGGWRVVAAGCESRTSRPYDCTLQGG